MTAPLRYVPSQDPDVYQSGTTSPRRTKMLRFKCLASGCGAVNIKPINQVGADSSRKERICLY
jgi:hypothetical protein